MIGSLPFFFGLAIVVPILGHSTWHLYRKVVEPRARVSGASGRRAAAAARGWRVLRAWPLGGWAAARASAHKRVDVLRLDTTG